MSKPNSELITKRSELSRTMSFTEMDTNLEQLKLVIDQSNDNLDIRLRQNMKRLAAEAGFNLVDGSFEEGASLSGWPDVVWCQTEGKYYQWHLDEAKTVAAGSTPETSGGIGAGAWVDRTEDTLRTDLASVNGSGLVGFLREGASAIPTTVQDELRYQAVNMLDFYAGTDGADYYPALTRAVAAIRDGHTKSRALLIPHTQTFWPVSQTVLFNVSNFTLLLYGNVKLTGTTRQKTFHFTHDTNPQPLQMLTNVRVYGNGSYVDGNGSAMTFDYAHGDNSDNDAAVKFNYIKGVVVDNIVVDNGPIDSMALRQCQNFLVSKCTFTNSKEDNGFSATTNFASYVYRDWDTYSYGWVVNCVAHGNKDLGMTAYDCAGVTFIGCRSYENGGGYSYEDDFASPNAKLFEGLYSDCIAYNNTQLGWYIDASGVTVDDTCRSYGNSYAGVDTDNLFGHGVLVSLANNVKIGGDHRYNQKAGLAIYNGSGMTMDITVSGIYNSNGWHGIHARGISLLNIKPGTECRFNGLVLVGGEYGKGINVDNSEASYLQGTGLLQIQSPVVSNNGGGAIYCSNVKTVYIDGVAGSDNLTMVSGIGVDVHNATTAALSNNKVFAGSTAQTFAYAIESSVTNGYDINNIGDGLVGVIANLASGVRQSVRGELIGSSVYDAPSLTPGGVVVITVTVIGARFGDFATASLDVDVSGLTIYAWVSGNNVVSVRLKNESGSTIDLASTTIQAMVIKRNAG